jgi:uncharacterized protein (DUF433 family)
MERLKRVARRYGRTHSEAAALLLEESLRQQEFTFVEFRDSPVGRQAYLKGSRLAIWQVLWFASQTDATPATIAEQLAVPEATIQAAFTYARAYPNEIDNAIEDQAYAGASLERLIPQLVIATVDAPPS